MAKKKSLKIIAVAFAILLIHALVLVMGIFTGTPLSWALVWTRGAIALQEKYPDKDYQIEKVGRNFKHDQYSIYVVSPTCVDEKFTVWLDKWGNVRRDNYDWRVGHRIEMGARLNEEYSSYVQNTGLWSAIPFTYHNHSAEVINYPSYYDGKAYVPHEDALTTEEMELNKTYDMQEYGRAHGELHLFAMVDDPSYDTLASMLLELKRVADEKGVAFYTVTMSVRGFEGSEKYDTIAKVNYFRYQDIYESDLAARAKENSDTYDRLREEAGLGEFI